MLNLSTSQAEDANLEHTNAQQLKKSESLSKFMQFKTNNLKLFEIDGKEITVIIKTFVYFNMHQNSPIFASN